MLVKQILYRNKCYPRHRYISLSIRKLIKILVKKYQLKHCPKHRQHFHFKKKPYRTFRQKVECKGAVQKAGKPLFLRKDCTEMLVLIFLYQKTTEITEKLRNLKKTVSKSLSKKVSYTEVAYDTVETPLSRKKSKSRSSSYIHPTKNLPKTPLKFAFRKDRIQIFFCQ